MTFERGHWVEVQPRPNPANDLPAGGKTYVMPLAPDDLLLARLVAECLPPEAGGCLTWGASDKGPQHR